MAHYALINSDNIVVQVITGVNENIIQTDLDGAEIGGTSEAWEQFYSAQPQFEGLTCKRTSYNGNIRANYAGIGFTYDTTRDAFIPPKPFSSWILNEETCLWNPPSPYPSDGNRYTWNEENMAWEPINEEG
jgi:hypothetical protein